MKFSFALSAAKIARERNQRLYYLLLESSAQKPHRNKRAGKRLADEECEYYYSRSGCGCD
jgi:hypothetical protein